MRTLLQAVFALTITLAIALGSGNPLETDHSTRYYNRTVVNLTALYLPYAIIVATPSGYFVSNHQIRNNTKRPHLTLLSHGRERSGQNFRRNHFKPQLNKQIKQPKK
jgi:hypothetical protein